MPLHLMCLQGAEEVVYTPPREKLTADERAELSGHVLAGNNVVVEAAVKYHKVDQVVSMTFEEVNE